MQFFLFFVMILVKIDINAVCVEFYSERHFY